LSTLLIEEFDDTTAVLDLEEESDVLESDKEEEVSPLTPSAYEVCCYFHMSGLVNFFVEVLHVVYSSVCFGINVESNS